MGACLHKLDCADHVLLLAQMTEVLILVLEVMCRDQGLQSGDQLQQDKIETIMDYLPDHSDGHRGCLDIPMQPYSDQLIQVT